MTGSMPDDHLPNDSGRLKMPSADQVAALRDPGKAAA
jgi:hypothetical protein